MVDIYKILVSIDEFNFVLDKIRLKVDGNIPLALETLKLCNVEFEKLNIDFIDIRILKNYILYPSSTDIQLLKSNGVTISRQDILNNKFIFIVDINHNRSISLKRKLILNDIIYLNS